MATPILYTLGHGTQQSDAFATILRAAKADGAVDVRRFPGSRRNPQFGLPAMSGWLAAAGIDYLALPDLGGRRVPLPDSPNGGLRNAGFRGFADHMATPAFRAALDVLLARARTRPTAMFCAETLWWHCHRRLIADAAVILHDVAVVHLTGATRATHVPTPSVRRAGDLLVYPP